MHFFRSVNEVQHAGPDENRPPLLEVQICDIGVALYGEFGYLVLCRRAGVCESTSFETFQG